VVVCEQVPRVTAPLAKSHAPLVAGPCPPLQLVIVHRFAVVAEAMINMPAATNS
jgi:hypothetical protein